MTTRTWFRRPPQVIFPKPGYSTRLPRTSPAIPGHLRVIIITFIINNYHYYINYDNFKNLEDTAGVVAERRGLAAHVRPRFSQAKWTKPLRFVSIIIYII